MEYTGELLNKHYLCWPDFTMCEDHLLSASSVAGTVLTAMLYVR